MAKNIDNKEFENFDSNNERLSINMTRWQSGAENLHVQSKSFTAKAIYLRNNYLVKKNRTASSIVDTLISPMSTSSSTMSLNSINNLTENLFSSSNDLSYSSTLTHRPLESSSLPTWHGNIPMKSEPTTMDQYQTTNHFSQKVFLGGIPAELTEAELQLVLKKFGKCSIKWPKHSSSNHSQDFCYVVFRESRSVVELLKHCIRQQHSTIDYFLHIHITSSTNLLTRTKRLKPIQIVPWNVRDSVYAMDQLNTSTQEMKFKEWSRTIFVSPLHGKMTAFSLASIMSDVFGRVSTAQINTDKYGYPTGTGTVLFADSHSYRQAVSAGAIDIECDIFHKLLRIDPFLRENEPCAFCPATADLFCRNVYCLRSFCKQCWMNKHGSKSLVDHQPATRRQQSLI